jgi:PIN domain nuclease of toxin-antitoxin system
LNLLLDTHVALWALVDSPRLPKRARGMILAPRAVVWISAATVWEIAIKHSLGRGDMPISGGQALAYFRESGYRLLPVEAEHAAAVESLPPHHSDPFDRLLIAQARYEPLRLLTCNPALAQYGEPIEVVREERMNYEG